MNSDTGVWVGWPIANRWAFALQGPTNPQGVPSGSADMNPPVLMVPIPRQGTVVPGPVFPVQG